MIIAIDGNEANVEKRLGVGQYAFELLQQFENFKFQISNFKFIIYLKEKPKDHMPKEREGWTYRVIGPKKFWTQLALPKDLFVHRPRPDVFFTPTHYGPRFSKIPTVISIMDLSYLYFPELFRKRDLYKLKNWSAYSVKNATKVLTISNASKDDIIKEYNVPAEKVVVTHLGIKEKNEQETMQNMDVLEKKYEVKGDYILFVGTLQPRKNIVRLIEAFSKIKGVTPQLVIVGKKGWQYEEILQAPEKFNVTDKVKFLDFVPDSDLPSFYKHAQFYILPSLYEGFGLPVLEAMQYGCPVITSNVSSLPEVGGDAVLYVDPENVADIAKKMQQLLTDKKLRAELIKKGKEQIKKFNWEKTAKETLKVLEEAAGK